MADITSLTGVDIGRLKEEILKPQAGEFRPDWFRSIGYASAPSGTSITEIRAMGIYSLFTLPAPFIYKNDLIVGSMRPLFIDLTETQKEEAARLIAPYPERNFFTHSDHFAPDFTPVIDQGIPGIIEKIRKSQKEHAADPGAVSFLSSMDTSMKGLWGRIEAYAKEAGRLRKKAEDPGEIRRLTFIENNLNTLLAGPPETFAQGLQLVWMIHSCFIYEGRYAMALGRIDQYLYGLYRKDIDAGVMSQIDAELLVANAFAKICERRILGGDDVVNICIGGIDPEGNDAVNGLSYAVLRAVRDVNMPGPNLSARISDSTPDEFLDECLKVIGTGLGYPALMNDGVNIPALLRYGYEERDVRNYCMVGCIENFLPGLQPPWVDGRFDPINYLEKLILGRSPEELDLISSMAEFMSVYEGLLAEGVRDYVECQNRTMSSGDPLTQTSPFLSCFADFCIERARDINDGGTKYPSVHGAALIGVGTVSDSLASIEKLVYIDRRYTLSEIARAMEANFEGFSEVREAAIAAPKYGNNDDFVDKYAVWYTKRLSEEFFRYRTPDGGGYYTAMAANISNIHAGQSLGATPDGRLSGRPLSDAASPTYGCDRRGVTSTFLSLSKPDYSHCACGTVVNQKFAPSAFSDGKREKLLKLIRVYFSRGGQEVQINSTSRKTLMDAMEHPENYPSLVVRVSGFSAIYVTLQREVQEDILSRTQHDEL